MKLYYGVAKGQDDPGHLLVKDLVSPDLFLRDNKNLGACPAVKAARNQTFIVRCPLDIDLKFYPDHVEHSERLTPEAYDHFILIDEYGFQIKTDYMFWTDSKNPNIQLWVHDIPSFMMERYEPWYVPHAMLPSNVLNRNIQIPIQLREGQSMVRLYENQPLMAITVISDQKIALARCSVPEDVRLDSLRRTKAAKLCPYTYAKKLFSKFN